jgi:hypothetical protein
MKKVCRLCDRAKAGNLIAILIKVEDSRREGRTPATIGPPKLLADRPLGSNFESGKGDGGVTLQGTLFAEHYQRLREWIVSV